MPKNKSKPEKREAKGKVYSLRLPESVRLALLSKARSLNAKHTHLAADAIAASLK